MVSRRRRENRGNKTRRLTRRVRTDGVSNVVGSVSEGGSASGDNLEEGEEVLRLVGVLGGGWKEKTSEGS